MGANGEDHTCIRQEDFDKVTRSTSDLQTELALNTMMTQRLEASMTKMVESVQKLSDAMITMQATQVTSEHFNQKFEAFDQRFREQKEKCVSDSIVRDDALDLRITTEIKDIKEKVIAPLQATVSWHEKLLFAATLVIGYLLANAFNIIDVLRKVL